MYMSGKFDIDAKIGVSVSVQLGLLCTDSSEFQLWWWDWCSARSVNQVLRSLTQLIFWRQVCVCFDYKASC